MLHVHHGNRTESLVDLMMAVIAGPLSSPLVPEVVVVQNPGMARWLSQRIATSRGIAANIEYPLPASFIWKIYGCTLSNVPENSRFQRGALLWRIMARLPARLNDGAFRPIQRYLSDGPFELKRYQLCRRIADTYDQYLVYRPDMILDWERGSDAGWQAVLWRDLVRDSQEPHRAALWKSFSELTTERLAAASLPERVCLFGLTAMAPAYLDVVSRLATVVDAHLFLLNPCREYWADIEDERGLARRRARWRLGSQRDTEHHYEVGNPLLASLGKVGQEFQDQLLALECEHHEAFSNPEATHLLAEVQRDMLQLRDRSRTGADAIVLDPGDRSIRIHSCHSPLREVQVLHDRLLEQFEQLTELKPRDVLVMAPDIDVYAPFVEAVFGTAPQERYIPYSIADRRTRAELPMVDTFLNLLDLPVSRLSAPDVLSWLDAPAVARRFGLTDQDVQLVRSWVTESGIRWGIDGAMRRELGFTDNEANTWSFGLDRLYLGYALPPEARLFDGVLPYPDVEGSDAEVLGKLDAFLQTLFEWRELLSKPCNAADWRDRGNRLLREVFDPDEGDLDCAAVIHDALGALYEECAESGYKEVFGVDLLREHLELALGLPSRAGRFLSGGITFCNTVPMRSIPFRVVCLLGMNDQVFPRIQRPVDFDLIAKRPRLGDRSRREDDRYLFLEALLSARDVFYLSYLGRSVRDNSPRVPSVVVSELMNYLGRACWDPAGKRVQASSLVEALLSEHPLQPFSSRCFDPSRTDLQSYATQWQPSSQTALESPFCFRPLAVREADQQAVVEVDAFLRFFENPARYFLEQRLRVSLRSNERIAEESEPFEINGLLRYFLRNEALDRLSATKSLDEHLNLLRGSGCLPHDPLGEIRYRQAVEAPVREFFADLECHSGGLVGSQPIDLEVAGLRLSGMLNGVTPNGLVSHELARLTGRYRLRAWLRHLLLNAVVKTESARVTTMLATDKRVRFDPVADALELLGGLAELFRSGASWPLPFFPECSFAYAVAAAQGKSEQERIWSAQSKWSGSAWSAGEGDEPHVRTVFRDMDPFSDPFPALAMDVFGPMIAVSSRGGRAAT